MDKVLESAGMKKSFGKSLLYTLPMFLITFMFMTGGKPNFSNPVSALAILTAFSMVNILYFFMHYTGKQTGTGQCFSLFSLCLSLIH